MTFPKNFKIDLKTKSVTFLNEHMPSTKRCSNRVLRARQPAEYYRCAPEVISTCMEISDPGSLFSKLDLHLTLNQSARKLLDKLEIYS